LFCLFVARWKKILVIVGPSILGAIVLVLGVIGFRYFRRTERRKRIEKPSEIVLREDKWRAKQQREKYKFSPQTGFIYGGLHTKSSSADCGVMV